MNKLLKRYQIYLDALKLKIPSIYWLLGIFIFSLILFLLGSIINLKLGLLISFIVFDLGIGIPIYLYDMHIRKIEESWPEALKLIADTMKAGSSFDYSIREVCSADFGELSLEFNEVVRRIEMGDTIYAALDNLTYRVDSKTVRRTVTLIKESLKTGAHLADVLEEIANDTKYLFRVKKERKTKTMLQTIFIVAAGSIIAPFIFGLTRVITEFLTQVSTNAGIATQESLVVAIASQNAIFTLLDIYIVLEVLAAAGMIAMMRDGKLSNIFIYFPVMITIAYVIYLISQAILNAMLSGMV